jgi:hypothetical protein
MKTDIPGSIPTVKCPEIKCPATIRAGNLSRHMRRHELENKVLYPCARCIKRGVKVNIICECINRRESTVEHSLQLLFQRLQDDILVHELYTDILDQLKPTYDSILNETKLPSDDILESYYLSAIYNLEYYWLPNSPAYYDVWVKVLKKFNQMRKK